MEWAGDAGRRPSVIPEMGGVLWGRWNFTDADASRRILPRHHPYFGSVVDVEALSCPPSTPISKEMFRLDPLILYPDENWTYDGETTVESIFTFQNNRDDNQ